MNGGFWIVDEWEGRQLMNRGMIQVPWAGWTQAVGW